MPKNLVLINKLVNLDITEFISYINTSTTNYVVLDDDIDVLEEVEKLGETQYENMGIIQHGGYSTHIR